MGGRGGVIGNQASAQAKRSRHPQTQTRTMGHPIVSLPNTKPYSQKQSCLEFEKEHAACRNGHGAPPP